MKNSLKSIVGATLLEIMLVLAIAAMIIVMSVRYYQSATGSQQANALLNTIQVVTAAADSMAQGTGGFGSGLASGVTNIVGAAGLKTPWGTVAVAPAGTNDKYTVTIASVPPAVCPVIKAKLAVNTHYTSMPVCSASVAPFTYIYVP